MIEAPPRPTFEQEERDDEDEQLCHRLHVHTLTTLCGKHADSGAIAGDARRRSDGRCVECGLRACPECEALWAEA